MKYLQMSFLTFFVLVLSSLISTIHCVDGKRNISKEEADDIKIQRYLRILNQKPVKTIITEVGDVINCINIYKQPAFHNPLLKNHKLKMNPSSILKEKTSKNVSSSTMFRWLKKERCPSGTVHIRRASKKQLLNAKYFIEKSKSIYANSHPNIGFHYVSAEEVVPGREYFGAAASMSLHNLTVDPDQFSTSQIWIMNTTGPKMNSIGFGIMKHPEVFGDSLTRLFGSWSVIQGQQIDGCFNVACDGFIQVSRAVFFGQPYLTSSRYGQVSFDYYLMVSRDQDGDWWLRVGPNSRQTENVGYWPGEIITLLRDSASSVRYGGYVGATAQAATPPMGNGHLPQLVDYTKTAFMRHMKYANEIGRLIDLDPHSVHTLNSAVPRCYDIKFAGQVGDWENTMAYGGPGGICN